MEITHTLSQSAQTIQQYESEFWKVQLACGCADTFLYTRHKSLWHGPPNTWQTVIKLHKHNSNLGVISSVDSEI